MFRLSLDLGDLDEIRAGGWCTTPRGRTKLMTKNQLPTGTVTFLFTDIESSTRLWAEAGEAMARSLERHDAIVRSHVEGSSGYVFATGGDGFVAAFGRADQAAKAAEAIQQALKAEPWPEAAPIRVRMAIHTGEAEERDGDYFGPAVNRAARLMAIAHGGQVLCSSTAASLVEGLVDLVDLGEHRLRDLDSPMHVFQLDRDAFPPLRSLDAYPGNLPVQLTSFVGRERESRLVAEAVSTDRLVTLTGTGGVGKTRLALQVGADALPAFPDGVWLCELAAASDPDSLLGVVTASLGTAARGGASPVDSLAEFIGDRHMLVVLDNCEHLLDEAADLAARLVSACRNLVILSTSREALDVPGERVIRLRSLDLPHADALGGDIMQAAASRLFLERAAAAGAPIELDDGVARAVAEVCRRLDGIPLAIELAAARTIAMSPGEVASHLDERFRLLTGRRRGAVERHHTLRAAIDWSYSLLTPTEQSVLDCLGVFPASFEGDAALTVAAEDGVDSWDVVDALTSLVAKSLLTAEQTTTGTTRYQMLESLRHYARERLEARGAADATRRRHARYFGDFIDRYAAGVQTSDDARWSAQFRAEFDNLRTAVLWGLDSDDASDVELALRILAAAISTQAGGTGGVLPLAAVGAARARTANSPYRSPVLMGASLDAFQSGDLARARQLIEESVEAGITPGSAFSGISPLVFRLAFARSADVPRLIDEGRRQLEELGATDWEMAYYLGATASMAALRGHVELARTDSKEALELGRRLRNTNQMVNASYAYALAWWPLRADESRAALEEAVPLLPVAVNEPIHHRALALLAQLRAADGHVEAALEALGRAVARAHANGDRQGMATTAARGISVLHAAGRDEAAAVLAGVVSGGLLHGLRALPPQEEAGFEQLLAEVSASLDTLDFESAVKRGTAMSYNEIVTFAADAVRLDSTTQHP